MALSKLETFANKKEKIITPIPSGNVSSTLLHIHIKEKYIKHVPAEKKQQNVFFFHFLARQKFRVWNIRESYAFSKGKQWKRENRKRKRKRKKDLHRQVVFSENTLEKQLKLNSLVVFLNYCLIFHSGDDWSATRISWISASCLSPF